jgi:integrase
MIGLYAKTQDGYYYYQPRTRKGKPRPKAIALGTRDELEAITRAREIQGRDDLVQAVFSETMDDLLPEYFASKSEDAKKSRKGREQILHAFSNLMGNPRVRDIDVELIKRWRKKLSTNGGSLKSCKAVSPASLTSYLIAVKAFFSWAVAKGYMKENPAKEFKGATTVRITRSQKFLTKVQREMLLSTPCTDYIGLILHLGFFGGLRDGEMLACNPSWIWISEDGTTGSLTVQDTKIEFADGKKGWWRAKGKRARKIPLHPRLLEFLENYGMRRPYLLAPDKPLWPADNTLSKRFDAKRSLKTHGKKCGIKNLGFHILRCSFATHLSMDGKPTNVIAALIGDTIKVTERHYIGFSPSRHDVLSGL